MKNLKDFRVHKWHDVPTMEIYDYKESAWIVYEQCTNFSIVHYVHASKESKALNKVYDTIIENLDDDESFEGINLSSEMILLTDEDIEWFKQINHS